MSTIVWGVQRNPQWIGPWQLVKNFSATVSERGILCGSCSNITRALIHIDHIADDWKDLNTSRISTVWIVSKTEHCSSVRLLSHPARNLCLQLTISTHFKARKCVNRIWCSNCTKSIKKCLQWKHMKKMVCWLHNTPQHCPSSFEYFGLLHVAPSFCCCGAVIGFGNT